MQSGERSSENLESRNHDCNGDDPSFVAIQNACHCLRSEPAKACDDPAEVFASGVLQEHDMSLSGPAEEYRRERPRIVM